jgi:hypothetical protein
MYPTLDAKTKTRRGWGTHFLTLSVKMLHAYSTTFKLVSAVASELPPTQIL